MCTSATSSLSSLVSQTTNDKFLRASYNSSDAFTVVPLKYLPAATAWLHVRGTLKESTAQSGNDNHDDTWFGDGENHCFFGFVVFAVVQRLSVHSGTREEKAEQSCAVASHVRWLDARPR